MGLLKLGPTHMKKQLLFGVSLLVAGPSISWAKDVLGDRYFSASIQSGDLEGLSFLGATATFNKPLFEEQDYSYDLNVSLGYSSDQESGIDLAGLVGLAGIVVFPTKEMEFKPYLSAHIGYQEESFDGFNDGSFTYRIGVGGEWHVGERFSIIPNATFIKFTEVSDENFWEYGISGNLWIDDKNSIGIGFSRFDYGDLDIEQDTVSGFYRLSF